MRDGDSGAGGQATQAYMETVRQGTIAKTTENSGTKPESIPKTEENHTGSIVDPLPKENTDLIVTVGDGENGNTYTPPVGGGGVTERIAVGNVEVSFGHGGRHLEGTGLAPEAINRAIANDVAAKGIEAGEFYKGQISFDGVKIEYTSYGVKDNWINVGTYYPVK